MEVAGININVQTNGFTVVNQIKEEIDKTKANANSLTSSLEGAWKSLLSIELITNSIGNLQNQLNEAIEPGMRLNTQMADFQAITDATDEQVQKAEKSARSLAKTYGLDVSQGVESAKLILSQLSPEIAQNNTAMTGMMENASILSKLMGGNVTAATEVLTTAMNQYDVSLDDPIKASKIMGDMMNIMAAGAQAGSAELPQIKQALEQTGMVAKTANVSFAETNAFIQVLDKAGKKGSEGGVALRNVIATLNQGRFLPKDAREELQGMGIDVEKLGDQSLSLADRLKILKPAMNDQALMTKIFGKENNAAAIAMIQGIPAAKELTSQIINTNTAVKQADTIMGSYEEKMKRQKARWDDYKISIFNATKEYLPFIQNTMTAAVQIGQLAQAAVAFDSISKATMIKSLYTSIKAFAFNTFFAKIYSSTLGKVSFKSAITALTSAGLTTALFGTAGGFGAATAGASLFQIALSALGIGLIIAAIVGLVYYLKYLWETSRKFREILFGIWEVGKSVFHNIGVFVNRLWEMVVKPIFGFIGGFIAFQFGWIWTIAKKLFDSIIDGFHWLTEGAVYSFEWLKDGVVSVFEWIWETSVNVFNSVIEFIAGIFNWVVEVISKSLGAIGGFFQGIWNWFVDLFRGFVGIIDEYVITPIREAFSGVWDWIVDLFSKVVDKLSAVFAPIKRFFKKLFSSENMEDLGDAYNRGEVLGGESFDKDQEKKSKQGDSKKSDKEVNSPTNVFATDGSLYGQNANGLGKAVGKQTVEKEKEKKTGSSGGSGLKNLTINKLVENITIQTNNFHESKESIRKGVQEALLTAVNDFNLAQ